MPGKGSPGPDPGRLTVPIAGLLLAAGRSTRYGRPKLIEPFRGDPLVRRAALAFLQSGCAPVLVTVPTGHALDAPLQDLPVRQVVNDSPARGIGHSIALGVNALPDDAPAVVIGVADQPLLTASVIERLLALFVPGVIVAPRYGTALGNPRVYDRRFFAELARLDGDRGGHEVAERHPDAIVEEPFPEDCGLDIDLPGDWDGLPGREGKGSS